jgi:hypothetical protein
MGSPTAWVLGDGLTIHQRRKTLFRNATQGLRFFGGGGCLTR